MMPIPVDFVEKMNLLKELDYTKWRWAGFGHKPSTMTPNSTSGLLSNQRYMFFHKDYTITTGTDIYFFADQRPKEITTVKELLEL